VLFLKVVDIRLLTYIIPYFMSEKTKKPPANASGQV